jgi:hypothetical protein
MCALSVNANAQAGEDEVFLTAGAEYSTAPNFRSENRGVGGSLAAFWGIHRLWSVGGQVAYSRHFTLPSSATRESGNVFSAFVGPSFNVDVLSVVPFLSLAPGVYADGGALGEGNVHFGVRGALGFDYRPSRHFAAGADIAWHVIPMESLGFPGYSVFRVRLSYVWDLREL